MGRNRPTRFTLAVLKPLGSALGLWFFSYGVLLLLNDSPKSFDRWGLAVYVFGALAWFVILPLVFLHASDLPNPPEED
jgi:hypothetical protein